MIMLEGIGRIDYFPQLIGNHVGGQAFKGVLVRFIVQRPAELAQIFSK